MSLRWGCNRLCFVGAAFSSGQPHRGVALAPTVLRELGLVQRLGSLGAEVFDAGDMGAPRHDPAVECRALAFELYARSRINDFVLTVGGDHGVGAGTVAGALRAHPRLGVIWVDAHGDLNTPVSSPTGNFHGMPLAYLLGLVDDAAARGFGWMKEP